MSMELKASCSLHLIYYIQYVARKKKYIFDLTAYHEKSKVHVRLVKKRFHLEVQVVAGKCKVKRKMFPFSYSSMDFLKIKIKNSDVGGVGWMMSDVPKTKVHHWRSRSRIRLKSLKFYFDLLRCCVLCYWSVVVFMEDVQVNSIFSFPLTQTLTKTCQSFSPNRLFVSYRAAQIRDQRLLFALNPSEPPGAAPAAEKISFCLFVCFPSRTARCEFIQCSNSK